jgi:hypothetical protein
MPPRSGIPYQAWQGPAKRHHQCECVNTIAPALSDVGSEPAEAFGNGPQAWLCSMAGPSFAAALRSFPITWLDFRRAPGFSAASHSGGYCRLLSAGGIRGHEESAKQQRDPDPLKSFAAQTAITRSVPSPKARGHRHGRHPDILCLVLSKPRFEKLLLKAML